MRNFVTDIPKSLSVAKIKMFARVFNRVFDSINRGFYFVKK